MGKSNALITSVILVLSLVLVPAVLATEHFDGTDVCRESGQRYDAATWVWTENGWEIEYSRPGFKVQIEGDQFSVDWESNKVVKTVIVETADGQSIVAGKSRKGSIQSEEAMEAVVLCLRGGSGKSSAPQSSVNDETNSESGSPENEIPEFGGMAAIATIGLVGATLVALKRRD